MICSCLPHPLGYTYYTPQCRTPSCCSSEMSSARRQDCELLPSLYPARPIKRPGNLTDLILLGSSTLKAGPLSDWV